MDGLAERFSLRVPRFSDTREVLVLREGIRELRARRRKLQWTPDGV
jgi:hypothetical protein